MTPLEYITKSREKCLTIAAYNLPDNLQSEAEDVIQDVTLSYLSKADAMENIDNVEAYVGSAITKCCWRLVRDMGRRMQLREENDDTIRSTYGYDYISPDPNDLIEAASTEDDIIKTLSELEKEIYNLVLMSGVSYSEAANKLHMAEVSIRQHVSRIKKKFVNWRTNNGR